MQVPMKNPSVRMGSMPNVSAGPMTDASGASFGANRYRQLGQLAGAVGDAGNALLAEAQKRQKEEDDTAARVLFDASLKRAADESQGVLDKHRGGKAGEAPAAMEEMLRTIHGDASKNLQNQHQKDAFDREWDRYQMHVLQRTYGWRDKESESFRINGFKSSIDLEKANAAETILDPDARGLFYDSLSRTNSAIDELTKDMPPEQAEVFRRATLEDFHVTAVNSLASKSPAEALEYLDSELAKEALPTAVAKQLRDQYTEKAIEAEQKAIIDQGVSQMIVAAKSGDPAVIFEALVREVGLDSALKVASGYEKYASLGTKYANQLSEQEKAEREQRAADEATVARDRARADVQAGKTQQEMRDIAYRDFNEKAAKIYLDTAEAERKALAADAATAAVNEERELLQKLEEVGFVPSRMVSWGRLTLEQKEKANDLAKKHGPSKPETKTDVGKYLDYQNMSDDELLDVFTDPKRRETAVADLGGVGSKWFGNVFDRIDPSKKSTKESKAKTEDITLLDSELNIIKRQADLAALDTGRTLGKEEAEIYSSRIVEDYNAKLEEFMETNELTSVKQIPLADRRRMRAETLLTYKVKTPGVVFDGTRVATEAEARAGGLSTEGAAVMPASLPAEQRKKYPGSGKVYRIQDEVGNDMMVVRNVSPDSAPEPVRTAAQTAGPGAVISRELETGEWTVAGPRFYQEYRADGTEIPKRFGETERAATERRLDEDDYLAEMAEPGENPWMTNARLFEERRSAGE